MTRRDIFRRTFGAALAAMLPSQWVRRFNVVYSEIPDIDVSFVTHGPVFLYTRTFNLSELLSKFPNHRLRAEAIMEYNLWKVTITPI